MCLSPQEKHKGTLVGAVELATRKHKSQVAAAMAACVEVTMRDSQEDEEDVDDGMSDLMDAVAEAGDVDDVAWISDDNLRGLMFDDRVNQEIDWVSGDELDVALQMEMASMSNAMDLTFGSSSLMSPLRLGLSLEETPDVSSSLAECLPLTPESPTKDAERLLMSFDSMMHFTIPSPTSKARKRSNSFTSRNELSPSGKRSTQGSGSRSNSGNVNESLSPSLKVKIGPASASKDEHGSKSYATASLGVKTSAESSLGQLRIATPAASSRPEIRKKIGCYSPNARKLRIQKFHEKRKNRTWKKSIKYDCRKKLADDRPRVKGRFVRVLDNLGDQPVATSPSSSTSSVKPESNETSSKDLTATTAAATAAVAPPPPISTASEDASPASTSGQAVPSAAA